ncbi:MAG: tetratricopeptide repeat protein [Woeseiaceae bacterium]|nr:tetratricopeptide repeat protein [Woeseiaceae bacterium]
MKSPLVEALRNATEEADDRHSDVPASPLQEQTPASDPPVDSNQLSESDDLELMETAALQRQESDAAEPETEPDPDFAATRSLEIDDNLAANEPGDSSPADRPHGIPGQRSTRQARMPRLALYAPLLSLGVGLLAAAGHLGYHWIIGAQHKADLAVLSDRDRAELVGSTEPLPDRIASPFLLTAETPRSRPEQPAANRNVETAPAGPAPALPKAPPSATAEAAPLRAGVADPAFRVLSAAFAAFQAGDIAAAESAYREALAISPRHPNALQSLAAILHATGRQDEAADMYDTLLAVEPDNAAAAAALLNSRGNVDVSGLKHLVQRHPDSGQLYFALGVQYSEQGKWGEARAAFADALRLEPGNPEYMFNLAVTLEHLQRYDEARGVYGLTLASADSSSYLDRTLIARRIDQLSALGEESGAGQ